MFEEAHPELHGDSNECQKKTPLNLLLNNKKVSQIIFWLQYIDCYALYVKYLLNLD